MTIDLDAIYDLLRAGDTPVRDEIEELLRLARDGERWRRQRCGACRHHDPLRVPCARRHVSKDQDWHCADWEEKP